VRGNTWVCRMYLQTIIHSAEACHPVWGSKSSGVASTSASHVPHRDKTTTSLCSPPLYQAPSTSSVLSGGSLFSESPSLLNACLQAAFGENRQRSADHLIKPLSQLPKTTLLRHLRASAGIFAILGFVLARVWRLLRRSCLVVSLQRGHW